MGPGSVWWKRTILDRTVDSKLANISTRGFVQTDDNVLIGGLIVLGQNPLRVIVRAIGPSLPFRERWEIRRWNCMTAMAH